MKKYGITVIDNTIVDLDNMPIEDLEKYEKKIQKEIEVLENKVDKLIGIQ